VLLCAKGVEQGTLRLMTQVLEETVPQASPAVLSGPSFAGEVARGLPTAVTLACPDEALGRALAEAMGGVLEARSEPGAGSRFTLTLDLPRASHPLAEPAPPLAVLDDNRAPRVLLAEDHPINRKVIELLFAGGGVQLTTVENGAEASRRPPRSRST